MAGETFGSDQWFVGQLETAGAGYAPIGYVTGGTGFDVQYDQRDIEGINQEAARRDGLIEWPWGVDAVLTPDAAWLLSAIEDMSPLDIGGSMRDGVTNVYEPAYMTDVTLRVETGGRLTASISGVAKGVGVGTPVVANAEITDEWNWEEYETTTKIGGASYGVQSVEYVFKYGAVYTDDCDGRVATKLRTHRDLIQRGLKSVDVNVSILAPPAVADFIADYPASDIMVETVCVSNSTVPITVTIQVPELKWAKVPNADFQAGTDNLVTFDGSLTYRHLKNSAPVITVA